MAARAGFIKIYIVEGAYSSDELATRGGSQHLRSALQLKQALRWSQSLHVQPGTGAMWSASTGWRLCMPRACKQRHETYA